MESASRQRADDHLARLCEPILEANGFELVEATWQTSRRQPLVRLLVHKTGGITVGECQKIHRLLEPMLRVEGVVDDRTMFEVASPGLDRPLRTESDFRRAEGYFVAVRRRLPTESPSEERLVGRLLRSASDALTMALDSGETVTIPFADVIEGKFDVRF
jgi:ribosome maturation factor RimP